MNKILKCRVCVCVCVCVCVYIEREREVIKKREITGEFTASDPLEPYSRMT